MKSKITKVWSLMLIFVLVAVVISISNITVNATVQTESKATYLLGDVNLDQKVNIKDATAIQKYLAAIIKFSNEAISVADFDEDNRITVKDATAIQKFIAGIIVKVEDDGIHFIDTKEYEIPEAYKEIIEKYIEGFPWNDSDSPVPNLSDVSYLYRYYDSLSDIGYAFADLDNNGEIEMFIGEVSTDSRMVFDMYTLVKGEVKHLFDGGERYRYSLRTDGSIINDWSSSASTSGLDKYMLNKAGDGLEFEKRVVYDAWYALELGLIEDINGKNIADKCNFVSEKEIAQSDYVNVTAKEAEELRNIINDDKTYVYIDYTPLSKYSYDIEDLEEWKNLYIQLIKENTGTYRYYSLVDIDTDTIPELYMHAGASPGDIVYTIKGDDLNYITCRAGILYYMEDEGIFCVDSTTNVNANQTESPTISYYKLNNGEFVVVNKGDFDYNKLTHPEVLPIEGAFDDIINW